MVYKIAEKFTSINGEGRLCGQLAVFIRFAGCNLNCSYCDTAWAKDENSYTDQLSKEQIYEYIKQTGVRNITITGGEPLVQANIKELLELLSEDESLHIEIETNGSVLLADFKSIKRKNISYTMDYKLESSGMEQAMNIDNLKYLTKNDVIKFVIGDKKDLSKVLELLNKYDLQSKTNVYFSTVFNSVELKEIVQFMIDNKLNNTNLQLQLHKIIWSPDERGV
ncbi:putative 7-carboxy-7-deazaguanine synthase QueE [Clostridiaceae bacterium M8S5]|nr:putative 7-carboxy-7-deazaguanine synthase QueE [Clostridiaceae bacterium M8S5]